MSKPRRPKADVPSLLSGEQRINKLLAAAGLGSRRQVDELIKDGRVEIDGQTVTQVGIKVDTERSKISVDGEPLKRHRPVYFAVNKPAGVLCTNSDPEGRPRVIDLVPGHARLFPVGRLDASSTGLIILTNDGELAQRLAHPKHSVPKTYFVVVAGQVELDSMRRLQKGIYLAEGVARVEGARIRRVRKNCTEIEITLSEGKNREIRRVLARLGHKVITLRRIAIGPLRLGTLPDGTYRSLTSEEVSQLYHTVEDIKKAKKAERKERDRNRAAEMGAHAESGANPESPASEGLESADAPRPKKEKRAKGAKSKSKTQEYSHGSYTEEADDILDTLPSIKDNPFRMSDDDDAIDDGMGDDAVLIRNSGSGMEYEEDYPTQPKSKGKVISYEEDADDLDDDAAFAQVGGTGFEDEDGDDEDGFFASDSEDSEDADETVPADSPWSKIARKPKGRSGDRDESNRGRPIGGNRFGDRRGKKRAPFGSSYSKRRETGEGGEAGGDGPRARKGVRGRPFASRSSGTRTSQDSQGGRGDAPSGNRRSRSPIARKKSGPGTKKFSRSPGGSQGRGKPSGGRPKKGPPRKR